MKTQIDWKRDYFGQRSDPAFGAEVSPSADEGVLSGLGKIGQVLVGAAALLFGWKVYQDFKPHIQSELSRRHRRNEEL
jgi:hypothetical protein